MTRLRSLMIGLVAAGSFALVAAVLLRVMRQPLRPTDAMAAGALATLAALLVLFVGFMTSTKQRDVFFKRRPKP